MRQTSDSIARGLTGMGDELKSKRLRSETNTCAQATAVSVGRQKAAQLCTEWHKHLTNDTPSVKRSHDG